MHINATRAQTNWWAMAAWTGERWRISDNEYYVNFQVCSGLTNPTPPGTMSFLSLSVARSPPLACRNPKLGKHPPDRNSVLNYRTDLYDVGLVRAEEFVRRVRSLARNTGKPCRFVAAHGKGSHGTLYYAGRLTVQDLKRELPTGTLHAML